MSGAAAHQHPAPGELPDLDPSRRGAAAVSLHRALRAAAEALAEYITDAPAADASRRSGYSPAFCRALAALTAHGFSSDHAAAALDTWHRLAPLNLREPSITPVESEQGDSAVQFSWREGDAVLTLSVLSDGRVEWFTLRADGSAAGTEEPEDTLTAELLTAAEPFRR